MFFDVLSFEEKQVFGELLKYCQRLEAYKLH